MIKKFLVLFLVIFSGYLSLGVAIDNKIPFFQKTYSLEYNQWNGLRVALYKIAIEEGFSYMDSSVPYPSGAHSLLVQMGRLDEVAVIVTATKNSENVSLNIECDNNCHTWLPLKDELTKLFH